MKQDVTKAKELVKFYDVTFFSTSRDKDLFANSPVNYLRKKGWDNIYKPSKRQDL